MSDKLKTFYCPIKYNTVNIDYCKSIKCYKCLWREKYKMSYWLLLPIRLIVVIIIIYFGYWLAYFLIDKQADIYLYLFDFFNK